MAAPSYEAEAPRRRWSRSCDFRSHVETNAPVPEATPLESQSLQRRPERRRTTGVSKHVQMAPDIDDSAKRPSNSAIEDHAGAGIEDHQVARASSSSVLSTAVPSLPSFDDILMSALNSSHDSGGLSSSQDSSAKLSPTAEGEEEEEEEASSPIVPRSLSRASSHSRWTAPATEALPDNGPEEEDQSCERSLPSTHPSSSFFDLSEEDDYDHLCDSSVAEPSEKEAELSDEEARLKSLELKVQEQEEKLKKAQILLESSKLEKIACAERVAKLRANVALEQGGGPEYWGISVQQLQDFCKEIKDDLRKYCLNHRYDAETWKHVCCKKCCRHNHGCAEYRPLRAGEDPFSLPGVEPNMHTVVQLYIKPRTQRDHGIRGLALTLNKQSPLKVEKFISHSWGGRFEDFVATISGNMLSQTVVFVCSFALPQNVDVGAILKANLHETPFAKAHSIASEVLLVIDKGIEVIERVWVVYELYLSMCRNKHVRIGLNKNIGADFRKAILEKVSALHIRNTKFTKKEDFDTIMEEIKGTEDKLSTEIRLKLTEMVHNLDYLCPRHR